MSGARKRDSLSVSNLSKGFFYSVSDTQRRDSATKKKRPLQSQSHRTLI